MLLISHRGNTNGRKIELENNPKQIEHCISMGYEVEIDIRLIKNNIYLGHDSGDCPIDIKWLESLKEKLWIHCKNFEALNYLFGSDFNFFWHDIDDYTLTSKGFLWTYPGKPFNKNSIILMPEKWTKQKKINCLGICSDYICQWS